MDAFVRRYVHENLSYRFVILWDCEDANALEAAIKAAYALETAIQGGKWEPGRPFLNPGK